MTLPPESSPWVGPERRQSDKKLEAAMSEVRHLYGSVEELAVAVSKSVPRDEIEAREKEHVERQRQFQQQARLIVAGLAALFGVLLVVTVWAVGHLDGRIEKGHATVLFNQRVTHCLETVPETTKVSSPTQALIQCRQSATEVKP